MIGKIRSSFTAQIAFLKEFVEIVLGSYSQVFFSTHRLFALLILLVTFFDFYTGLFGLISVMVTAVAGISMGFDRFTLRKGLLGFNSLLVGLGLGVYFSPTIYLVLIVVLAALFTFFISISLLGVIGKYGLPFLSIPFILALWIFMLATSSFHMLGINERGIFTINELYQVGGQPLINLYDQVNNLGLPAPLRAYFVSLSAILFQYNVLSGFVLSLGLLLFSRIAFSLSLIGFFLAYGFYSLIGAEIAIYDYSFFGFNYILSSIALGGFFLIPSRKSYLWMILVIPFVAILTISLNSVFMQFKLPIYSLPFNLVVFLFIYSLKFREKYSETLSEVYFQYNAPEKNLYIFLNNKERFRFKFFTPIKLPFFGSWKVSQGHDGEHTHKGFYRYAWDFNIEGPNGQQFKNRGDYPEDYYCFNKPVIAPGDGVVEKVTDGIDDNIIGKSNLIDNWGNTIIIKHPNDVYTKVSHLKKGSITVKKGEEVKYGQIIGQCGNSGRSSFPHLHFQIQSFPYIGSVTMDYPISHFIEHKQGSFTLHSHSRPKLDQWVSNIEVNSLMASALDFIPGQMVEFTVVDGDKQIETKWEIRVNELNQAYFYCSQTEAIAYFESDKTLFYFTYFEGDKQSYLYLLFLSMLRVQKVYYQDLVVVDQYPLYLTFPRTILWFHDFISPFVQFIKSQYTIKCKQVDDSLSPSKIVLESAMKNYFMGKLLGTKSFNIEIDAQGIKTIQVISKKGEVYFKR